jgi:purine nucleosidase
MLLKFRIVLVCLLTLVLTSILAQQRNVESLAKISPRIRVIVDNDFGGDPDGLFQLAHHLLSSSVEVKAIIGSPNYQNGFYGLPGTSSYACVAAKELLKVMKLDNKIPVLEGGLTGLQDTLQPVISDGAKAIVNEAMRTDTKQPLYVVCGAGLTTIASAYLIEPKIAKRIKLIWIGGSEYPDMGIPTPGNKTPEYNLGIDIKAAQVVFNLSDIPIWQVPRNTYRQAIISYSELKTKVANNGNLGRYLVDKIGDLMNKANGSLGETYVLGDSPLVLLTALQTSWETDPASSKYKTINAPYIDNKGKYKQNTNGRGIRVYSDLDVRLMFEDFISKICLFK